MVAFNVVIVGGGLAGSCVAHHLDRLGIRKVAILERLSEGPFERYHSICGEAVSDRMLKLAGIAPQEVVRRIDSIEIVSPSGAATRIPVKGSIVDRVKLVEEMRSMSRAKVLKGNVLSIERKGSRFLVHTADEVYECNHLVGADGAHSVVRRDIFGSKPERFIPTVNHIVKGESDGVLRFRLSEGYKGGYRWEFPSKGGFKSVGYVKDTDSIDEYVSRGARNIPIGRVPKISDGHCSLVGDAAGLCNPLCFGGIGVALLSGRKAAEGIAFGTFKDYQKWLEKDRMFDPRFMEAHDKFAGWDDATIEEALAPMAGEATLYKGLRAILRRRDWTVIYMGCWFGFGRGW